MIFVSVERVQTVVRSGLHEAHSVAVHSVSVLVPHVSCIYRAALLVLKRSSTTQPHTDTYMCVIITTRLSFIHSGSCVYSATPV